MIRSGQGSAIGDSILKILCKRTSEMKLPVETGKWRGLQRNDRICTLCNMGIGDEFHYLFLCNNTNVKQLRSKFIPSYYQKNKAKLKWKECS